MSILVGEMTEGEMSMVAVGVIVVVDVVLVADTVVSLDVSVGDVREMGVFTVWMMLVLMTEVAVAVWMLVLVAEVVVTV